MTSSKKQSVGTQVLRIAGIISSVLLGLILIASVLLLTVLEPYAERFLKKKVTENTKGLYSLTFDDLDINLLATTIRLHGPQLEYASETHQTLKEKGEAGPFLLQIKVKEIELAGINLLDYLFSSRINIHSILIDQPEVKVIHDTEIEQQKDSSKSKQRATDIITSLRIGTFNLNDAQISYSNYENSQDIIHEVPQLNIMLSDFTADSLDRKDIRKMIDMDDLYVSLKNQSFVTGNKSYQFYFDLFRYSMAEEDLTIKAFSAVGDHTKMQGPMIAPEIQVPLFKLKGLDIIKALKTRELYLKELLIDDTFVKLLEIPDLDITVADVYRGLAPFFETTKIDNLNIDRSAVSMYSRENRDVLVQKIEQVDLSIEDVFFDSLSVFDSRNNLALQDLELKIENYLLTPENNPYTFKLARMEMRTKEDFLQLKELSLIPDIQQNSALRYQSGQASAQLIKIMVPEIRFEGIDMIRAFENSNFEISKIEIPASNVSITKAFEKSASGNSFSPEAVYESFSFYVKQINIHNFLVGNTDIAFYHSEQKRLKQHHVQNAELKLTEIHFDSLMAYQGIPKSPIQELQLEVQQYQFKNAETPTTFAVGPVQYSSNKEELAIRDIQFKSFSEREGSQADSIVIAGESLFVSELNVVKAFNRGYLDIEEILLKNPDVFVSREAQTGKATSKGNKKKEKVPGAQIFQWINPITVKSIRIVDGEAGYAQKVSEATNFQTLEGFAVEIQQLNLSPETIRKAENVIPVDNIIIKAKNYKFQSPDSIYTLKLDSLFYGSASNFLTAQYFQLSPDYELHNYRVENDVEKAHRNLFRISTDKFKLNDFDLIKAYNNDRYTFGEVVLNSPELAILQDKNVKKDEQRTDSTQQQLGPPKKNRDKTSDNSEDALEKAVQEQIDKYVDIFKIETFQIEDAKFLFEIQKKDSVRESQELDHLSLLIENIQLADLQANDLTKVFLVDEIDLLLKDYNFVLPDSLYELRVNRVSASLEGQYIRIDSVNFEPLFLIEEYADKLDYAQDRFDFSVGDINVEGIDFSEFFDNQNYFIENILIDGLNGSIYRDSRVEQDPSRKPRTVQQLIKDLPIPLKIDTLHLQNALLKYSEVSKDGSMPGITTLADTNIKIINITNDSLAYTLKDEMTVAATSSFLGESKLTVDFVFSMDHPEDLYTYEGYLEQMKFEALNPLLTNILFVEMESGMIEKLDFSITATKHRSIGVLHFPYQNFRFKILNRDDPNDPGLFLKAANWSLNNLLIKSNNPGKLFNNYRRGTIEVDRNYSKSVFNHMGNSLLSGFISSTIPEPTKTIIYFFSDLP